MYRYQRQQSHKGMKAHMVSGFTLLEMLLSVAIMALLAGTLAPVYQSFQNRNDLDIAVNTLVQTLRRAQLLSQSSSGDSAWGVRVTSGEILLFLGSSSAARNTSYDESYSISPTIVPSGTSEIVFAKWTGTTTSSASITLTSINNDVRSLSMTTRGIITY